MPLTPEDSLFMDLAIEEATKSVCEPGKLSPRVGAVVVKATDVVKAFRGELGAGDHAEYTALEKKARALGLDLAGATVYTTLEPCTERSVEKTPCYRWLIQHRVARVVVGMMDPNPVVAGKGLESLRDAGIEVDVASADHGGRIKAINGEWMDQYDGSRQPWRTISSMRQPRERHAAVVFGGGVLVTGGSGHKIVSARAECELYNARSDKWVDAPPMHYSRTLHTATALHGGSVLVSGGFDANSSYLKAAEMLSEGEGRWSSVGNAEYARVEHTATLLPDGRVLVCGGYFYDSEGGEVVYLNAAETFDATSRRWARVGDMRTPRAGHTATLLADGRVLVVGGRVNVRGTDIEHTLAEVEIFDPSTNAFLKGPKLSVRRAHHAAQELPTGVLVVGGVGPDGESLNSSELFSYDTIAWSRVGDTRVSRIAPKVFLTVNDLPVLTGGFGRDRRSIEGTERFDPARRAWESGPKMRRGRYNASVTRTDHGTVLAGGMVAVPGGDELTATSDVEIFQH